MQDLFVQRTVEYGRMGPTEVRLVLIVLNTVLALGARPSLRTANWTLGGVLAAMALVFVWRLARNLSRLASLEPEHGSPGAHFKKS